MSLLHSDAYSGVPYITMEASIYNISEYIYSVAWHYLLCDTGVMSSIKTLQQHVQGDKHQRLYQILKWQWQAWWLDQQGPDNFEYCNYDDSDDGTISYFLPFHHWHKNQWKTSRSCQLCGTTALPTWWATTKHCATRKCHVLACASTYLELHPECQELM
jgi:hypothetical protein